MGFFKFQDVAGCCFFLSNVDGFTENYTKLVQKRKHAHLESVGCTQIAASILWSRKISRIFLVFPLIPLLTNVKIFQPATGSLLCQRSKSNHHGMWTVDLNFEDKKNVIGAGTRKEEPLVHDCFFLNFFLSSLTYVSPQKQEVGGGLNHGTFTVHPCCLQGCFHLRQILVVAASCGQLIYKHVLKFLPIDQDIRSLPRWDFCQAQRGKTLVSFDDEHKVLVNHNNQNEGSGLNIKL